MDIIVFDDEKIYVFSIYTNMAVSDVLKIHKILTNYSIYRFINVNIDTYLSIESVYF